MSSQMSDEDHHQQQQQQSPHDKDEMMIDDHHTAQSNHTGHDQQTSAAHLLSSPPGDGQSTAANRLTSATNNSIAGLQQPFSPPPPHPTPHPALLAAVPSAAPSSSSPSSLSSRVNTFRSACLDCLISHQTHHLIPHSSKVVIFDSKLKVSHAFDGLVTHDINCFPALDTRVLTDRGFAFLDEIENRLAAGECVLYGCYDVASKGLVYRPGEVVFDQRAHQRLVSLASADEKHRWADGSDMYGTDDSRPGTEHEQDVEPGVSLRVTRQHLMYSQLGQLSPDDGSACEWTAIPPSVRPADSLLSLCSCPPHMSQCSHRTAATRLVALAESGYTPTLVEMEEANIDEQRRQAGSRQQTETETAGSEHRQLRWKQVSATLPVVRALQLSSADEWCAFLAVLGFWLGDGSLWYDESGQPQSLHFGRKRRGDHAWLASQLLVLGLANDRSRQSPDPQDSIDSLHITDARWLNWFNEQFAAKDTAPHPSAPISTYYRHQHAHSPQSATPFPPSSPASPSSSSSRLSYWSDADIDPHSHNIVPHLNQPDQMDTRKRKRSDDVDSPSIDTLDAAHSSMNADSEYEEDDSEPLSSDDDEWTDATESTKRLPDWLILQLTAVEMRSVIRGLWRAAGSWRSCQDRIWISSVEQRDQLMQALLHCGYSPCAKLARQPNNSATVAKRAHNPCDDERAQYVPVRARCECWAVTWTDLSSETAERSSWPTLLRQRDVSLVEYDSKRDGRLWCVNVQHPDHLILAQRAHRCEDGRVTKQSRPIIVGNCAPVWDSTRRKYVGLLSVSDFLDILLATANEADRTVFLSLSQQRLCDWAEFKRRRGTSISRLLCISPESTLHEAVRQLLNYRVHRLCVVQLALADTILRILTNHGILRFLRQSCPQMATVSVRDLGIGVFENLLTLTYQTPISRAMEMLSMYRVSSIPVVDAHGRPVDVYSRSDIRYLAMDNAWTNLDISIEQALQPHQHGRTLPLCTRDDTLQTVAGLLIACNKHSLICVHPATGVVEGVVSLTDIFSFILNTGPPQAESRVAALRADLERERGVVDDAQAMATAAGAGQLSEEELIRRGLAPSLETGLVGSVPRSARKGSPAVEDSEMGEQTIPEDEDFLR